MGITLNSYDKIMTDYQDAVHGVTHMLYTRIARPWLYSDIVYNLTKYGKLERGYLKILHQFTTDVIKERDRTFNVSDLENLEQEDEEWEVYSKKRLAMLDLLLLAKRSGEIDDDGIREEVNTFLFAGHDTVSMGLSFCLFMLANHKHVQEKVRAEMDEIFKDSERPASFDDLKNMKYLEMCIKETLRIYPSVAVFSRYIDEDVELRGGKYTIPARCIARIHAYDLHRDARVFPDPENFDPDRFLPENIKGRHPYAYIPFSAGLRNCLGQKFAMLEMKSLISAVIRRYEMDPVDKPENISLMTDIVLRPKDGIHIKFKPRVR